MLSSCCSVVSHCRHVFSVCQVDSVCGTQMPTVEHINRMPYMTMCLKARLFYISRVLDICCAVLSYRCIVLFFA